MKPTLANWNGQEMPLAEVKVSVMDRAFLFGDAVYEVIRVYSGRPWKLDEHLDRLKTSLEAIRIENIDVAAIQERILSTIRHSTIEEALVYVQVTRGEAKRTHYFPKQANANQLIYVEEFADPYVQLRQDGASVITHQDIRWSKNYIKATSLLANCLAAQEAVAAGCVESILLDKSDYVTEGSHTSVFGVKDGCVLVAPDSPNVLPGITKRQVLALARRENIPIREERLHFGTGFYQLDELFLSGTPEEILPVTTVNGRRLSDSKPGPVATRLQKSFRSSLSAWLKRAEIGSASET
jgi:D-alanine transaminase